MQHKLPTALQLVFGKYLIFNERGVILRTDEEITGLDPELHNCWALADSNDVVGAPSVDFRKVGNVERLIQTTSPRVERWKDWAKYSMAALVIMDLPSALDVAAVA